MAVSSADAQQELAGASTPVARFQELPPARRREVFFQLPGDPPTHARPTTASTANPIPTRAFIAVEPFSSDQPP